MSSIRGFGEFGHLLLARRSPKVVCCPTVASSVNPVSVVIFDAGIIQAYPRLTE